MSQTGTDSTQDRARQPKRAGGNSAEYGIEEHGQKKATRVGICGEGGAGKDTGTNKIWGAQFEEGGNSAKAPIEKHDQPKAHGKRYVGGVLQGPIGDISLNIQVDIRGKDTSGNASEGGTESNNQTKGRTVSGGTHRLGKGD